MGLAAATTALLAVLSGSAAAFHLWLYGVRPGQREHLWLALTGLGVGSLSIGFAALYDAQTREAARVAQQICAVATAPVLLVLVRFSEHFLEIDLRRLEVAAWLCTATTVGLVLGRPDWVFETELVTRQLWFPDASYVELSPTPAGRALIASFSALAVAIFAAHARYARFDRKEGRLIFGALGIWLLAALHDAAVGLGWQPGPYLLVGGFLAFFLVFTSILMGRFAESVEQVHENADVLHRLVEEQTQELRQREIALAHGDRMATLGTLAAGVAHEINNPIAFISSNLNQLSEAWKSGDAVIVEEMLAETHEGVDRIRAIVAELLTLARRGDGVSERVDLRRVVSSVLPLLRHEAAPRARIETQLGPVRPVLGDERLLGQVVLNLALNSLHSMDQGSYAQNVLTVSTAYEDGSSWLVVRDTGSGIPEEVLPHIFDPFFTTKEQGQGTGLGLAVTHQIVSRHRGRIDVTTGAAGTTVTVELPPADEDGERS